jgi:hypothetical protein
MDEKIINAAKTHARKQGVSLSKLVADYLRMISTKSGAVRSASSLEPTPILSEITGVLRKVSRKRNLRKEYHRHVEDKYL